MNAEKPCAKCQRNPEGKHCQPCGSPAWESFQQIDKCREAWEEHRRNPLHDSSAEFANSIWDNKDLHVWIKSASFHAGYHARKVPTVEEILTVCAKASKQDHEADNERIAKAIHRLMVEGGE